MEWEEISRRLRNGTSVQILADLAGCTYKTMYNRIRQHERKDGKKYIKPEQMKRPFETKRKKAEPAQDEPEYKSAYVPEVEPIGEEKAPALPEVVEKVADVPEVPVKLPEVLNAGYEIQQETIDEINQMFFQCKLLSEKYQKQAEDWRRIMEACASWSNAKEGGSL